MPRRIRGSLPKKVQKAIQKKREEIDPQQTIPPFRSGNPAVSKPPEIIRTPEPRPFEEEEHLPILRPTSAIQVLEKLGSQALVGYDPDGANEFWITLKKEVFGGMQLRITLQKGRLSALMIAPNPTIQLLLKRKAPLLRRQLEKRGIIVDKIEINLPQR